MKVRNTNSTHSVVNEETGNVDWQALAISRYERVQELLQWRNKALAMLKDIAVAQIRGADHPQLRSMLVDAIADLQES